MTVRSAAALSVIAVVGLLAVAAEAGADDPSGLLGAPSGGTLIQASGSQDALTPEQVDATTDNTQSAAFSTPLVVPLLVPNPSLYAMQKQAADSGVPSEESAGLNVDSPLGDLQAVANADQAAESPEDLGIPAEGDGNAATPGAAGGDATSAPSSPATIAPSAAVAGTTVAANRSGLSAEDFAPPDTNGAIGPHNYVETVNQRIAVYRRGNLATQLSTTPLPTFVGARRDNVFDPQIQWDPQANRFFYLADRQHVSAGGKETNYLAFGWSRTANPRDLSSGGWCKFFYPTGGILEDFPKLGHSDDHLIFGSDLFDHTQSRNGPFLTARISVLAKPANGVTGCTQPTRQIFGDRGSELRKPTGELVFAPIPANLRIASPLGFVVAADNPQQVPTPTQITTYVVPPGVVGALALVRGEIAVPAYQVPPSVPQPRTTFRLDSLDTQLTQAVATSEPALPGQIAVWTAHAVRAPDGRSLVRWYELLPIPGIVRQQGDMQSAGRFDFNGTISPTSGGDSAIMSYNVGNRTLLARIRASSRHPATPLGTLTGEVTLARSSAADRDFSCRIPGPSLGICRWGDYSGASADPLNNTDVWGSNQIQGRPAGTNPTWRTHNFDLR